MTDTIQSAAAYHWATAYSRHRMEGHALDFNHYPVPVKSYDYFAGVDISHWEDPMPASLGSIFYPTDRSVRPVAASLRSLAGVLFYGYGVLKRFFSGQIVFFKRPVPSAGGLYPCHLYLLIEQADDIETGLYYCDMIHQKLGLIQKIEAPRENPGEMKVSFFITAQVDISAWKYRQRAFRYVLLDAGHLLEGLTLALTAYNYASALSFCLLDEQISSLLSLKDGMEYPVYRISVNTMAANKISGTRHRELPIKKGKAARLLKSRFKCPRYGLLDGMAQVLKRGSQLDQGPFFSGRPLQLSQKTGYEHPDAVRLHVTFERVVPARSSRRNFIGELFAKNDALALIQTALNGAGFKEEMRKSPQPDPFQIVFTCETVEGFENGRYFLSKNDPGFMQLEKGDFHNSLAQVCLDQMWMSRAAMNFLFICDLTALESNWGSKGYAQISVFAGKIAHRLYLTAQALNMGCCGVGAFYDFEAQDLLCLEPDQALLYVISVGKVDRPEKR